MTRLPNVPYEDHLLITFKFKVPQIQEMEEPCNNETLCDWEAHLSALTDTLEKAVDGGMTVTRAKRRVRTKRGFFSIAAAAIPTLIQHFPKLLQLFKSAPTQVEPSQAVVKFDADIAESSSNLPQKLAKMYEAITQRRGWGAMRVGTAPQLDERLKNLNRKVSAVLKLNTLDQSLEQCQLGFLSPRLVKMWHLKAAIKAATTRIGTAGAQLVIPPENASAYYSVKGATCLATAENFLVQFRVPIMRRGSTPQLFNVHPAPYKVRDVTCYFMAQPMQVALVMTSRTSYRPTFVNWMIFFVRCPETAIPPSWMRASCRSSPPFTRRTPHVNRDVCGVQPRWSSNQVDPSFGL